MENEETSPMVYDDRMTVRQLLEHVTRGEEVRCPRCSAVLLVALDDEAIARLKVHRGVYCPKDIKHVAVYVEVSPSPAFWNQFGHKERSKRSGLNDEVNED